MWRLAVLLPGQRGASVTAAPAAWAPMVWAPVFESSGCGCAAKFAGPVVLVPTKAGGGWVFVALVIDACNRWCMLGPPGKYRPQEPLYSALYLKHNMLTRVTCRWLFLDPRAGTVGTCLPPCRLWPPRLPLVVLCCNWTMFAVTVLRCAADAKDTAAVS